MYEIRIEYSTGDSFRSEDTFTVLDYDWKDIDVAVKNLERIKEHYEMYQGMANTYHASYEEMRDKYNDRDWFVEDDSINANFIASHSLYLYTDDGKRFQYRCEWCGYFETLYGGRIVGPKFTV